MKLRMENYFMVLVNLLQFYFQTFYGIQPRASQSSKHFVLQICVQLDEGMNLVTEIW